MLEFYNVLLLVLNYLYIYLDYYLTAVLALLKTLF